MVDKPKRKNWIQAPPGPGKQDFHASAYVDDTKVRNPLNGQEMRSNVFGMPLYQSEKQGRKRGNENLSDAVGINKRITYPNTKY